MKKLHKNRMLCTVPEKTVPDLVQNSYNTAVLNHLWCVDFTSLGRHWAFVIMDCASRRVIAFQIKENYKKRTKCSFSAEDCIATLSNAFLQENPPAIMHSDNGGQFKSAKYIKFLKEHNIEPSMADTEVYDFGNQIIERLFRTLKGQLNQQYPEIYKTKEKARVIAMFEDVVRYYNDKVHASLIGLSPNVMQDALALYGDDAMKEVALVQNAEEGRPADTKLLLARSLTDEADSIEQIKATVVKKYAGDWLSFFLWWRDTVVGEIKEEIRGQTDRLLQEQRVQSDYVINSLKEDHALQLSSLKKQLSEMQGRLEEAHQRALQADVALKAKEEQKARRLNRKQLPTRDMAGLAELKIALDFIAHQEKRPQFTRARDVVCIFLMFITGVRVGNLLKLNISHIQQIINDQRFDLILIKKKKPTVQSFVLPAIAYPLFKEVLPFFETIIKNKNDADAAIAQEDSTTPVRREYLTERINEILRHVSKVTHKNIKTHSFRINLTTALIETVGIDAASKAIGHADIRTTEMYSRRNLGANEINNSLNLAYRHMGFIYNKKLKKKEYKQRLRWSNRVSESADKRKEATASYEPATVENGPVAM
jgi:site-specific recombinase XerD